MPRCPYCNKEMEELFDGEGECPKCGETFVDVGFVVIISGHNQN